MSELSRRRFLQAAALGAAGAAGAALPTADAIEPIRRPDGSRIRLSLAAYSFNGALSRRPMPTMTLNDFVDLAGGYPLDAVELTAYYFPEPITNEYLAQIKGRCTRLGLDVSGTAIRNDFCVADPARLREQIAHVKTWTERSARLGAKTMRIFGGHVPQGSTEEQARTRCVEAIQECAEHAGTFGLYLALEAHPGIVSTVDQLLAVVRAVRSDWFGVNFDTGNFVSADPYADLARIAPYAVLCQMKTEIQRTGMAREAADLRRLFQMLRTANYRGYVVLEYEAAEDPREAVPRTLRQMRDLCGQTP
jgi:sugar phosphate isomerase/epimerase